MSREPAIHLVRKDLILVLKKSITLIGNTPIDFDALADRILRNGRGLKPLHRSVIVTNEKLEKKIQKTTKSNLVDANLFAQLLFYERKKLRHRSISLMKPNNNGWVTIKELAEIANEFSIDCGYERREGYIRFISTGLSLMKNFNINKLKSLSDKIYDIDKANKLILTDQHPTLTKQVHDEFVNTVAQNTGLFNTYDDRPDKYQYFVMVADFCKSYKLPHSTYLKAQFKALESLGAYPDPIQLVGEKAKERLSRYLYNIDKKLIDYSKTAKRIDWSKIKGDE